MCCFSRPVELVAATKIFARAGAKGRQFIVYSMTLHTADELAMILPIPVPEKSADDAVRFINLEKYPEFFADLNKGFPDPPGNSRGVHTLGVKPEPKPLPVVDVGSFEASFVPSIADFSRLDERFRLPEGTWSALPQYKKFGFAVFKLKPGRSNVHPMAFEFPRASEKQLFFPTVHIHDGKVHDTAEFDHLLYCQVAGDETPKSLLHWRESSVLAGEYMKTDKTAGIVDPKSHCFRQQLEGKLKNQDTLV